MKKLHLIFLILMGLISFSCNKNNNMDSNFLNAADLYSKGKLEESENICNEILRSNNNHYPALLLKSKIMFYSGRRKESIKVLNEMCKKFPSYVDGKLFLIKVLIEYGDYEKAKEMLDEVIKENGSDYRIYVLYSKLAKETNCLGDRLAYGKRVEKCIEDATYAFIDLASIYENFGLKDISANYLGKAECLSLDAEFKKAITKHAEENR